MTGELAGLKLFGLWIEEPEIFLDAVEGLRALL